MFKKFISMALVATSALFTFAEGLIPNSDFEKDDGNGWAKDCPKKDFVTYINDNRKQHRFNHTYRRNSLQQKRNGNTYRRVSCK